MIQININFFLFIATINFLLLLLVRFLVKKNIFINRLAHFSIFLQILIVLFGVLRERNFPNIDFEITLGFMILTNFVITLLPTFFQKALSEQKKLQMIILEEDVKLFLLNAYDAFLENKPRVSKIFYFFAEKVTFCIFLMIQTKAYFFILVSFWLIFVILFFFETFVIQQFIYSPYCFVYFLFNYRVMSFATYIAKNTSSFYYIEPLRNNFKIEFPEITLLSFYHLKDLVLNNKTKEAKLIAWKNLNFVLIYSCDFFKINLLYYVDLPAFKKTLNYLNLSFVSLSAVCYCLAKFNFLFLENLVYLSGGLIIGYYSLKNFKLFNNTNTKVCNLRNFLFDLPEFLKHFQYVLVTEHDLRFPDLTLGKINYSFFPDFWIVIVKKALLWLSCYCTFILIFLNPYLNQFFCLILNFEPLLFFKLF